MDLGTLGRQQPSRPNGYDHLQEARTRRGHEVQTPPETCAGPRGVGNHRGSPGSCPGLRPCAWQYH
eukprot:11922715-Heterocapsa_arctica.AAC.1